MAFTGPDGPNQDTHEIIRGAADLPRRILLVIHRDAGSADAPEGGNCMKFCQYLMHEKHHI